jgi:hypothetical protein
MDLRAELKNIETDWLDGSTLKIAGNKVLDVIIPFLNF